MTHDFKRFPLLYSSEDRREADRRGWPISVPLGLVAPHEPQAQRNHYQSLKRLAERGGLSPAEMLAVITDQDYRAVQNVTTEQALQEIMRLGGLKSDVIRPL